MEAGNRLHFAPSGAISGKISGKTQTIGESASLSRSKKIENKKKKPEFITKSDFYNGGDGEIRTLEELLTLTRFPIVRARPTTRHLRVAQE